MSPDGSTLFISLWGGAKVLVFDARTLESRGEIGVGEHPNAMAITTDGKRLFVFGRQPQIEMVRYEAKSGRFLP